MADESQHTDISGPDDLKRRHILLVDDEDMITDMAKEALEGRGYSVSVFNDPRAALETFRDTAEKFDLILVDHAMPEMSGTQLAEECRSIRSTIPIVMATGYSQGIDEGRMAERMFSAILEKPYRLKTLCDKIGEILG